MVMGTVLALALSGLTAPATAPANAGTVPVVTSGGGHSCALMTDQSVWCWGRNTTGQLGNGTVADSLVPVWVRTLPPAINVSAGHDHTCAVSTSNQVWCWGSDAFGELGNGSTSTSQKFPVLALGVQALQVSAGDGFTCAVTLTHTVKCWGDNNFGELGDGTLADSSTPVKVKNLTNVTQVAAGYFHACALESSGTVWCWGDNSNGQLGDGSTTSSKIPVIVPLQNANYVAAGASDTCAILSAGDLQCWGLNFVGELGTGDFTDHHLPTQVVSLSGGVSQVTLGEDFGCAIATSSGPAALCWGDADGHGQLGNGDFTAQIPVPTPVFGLMTSPAGGSSGPQQIAAGAHHTCVVLVSGLVDCWGQGFYGNLGNGSGLDRAIPTPVIGLPGPAHTAGAVSAGTLTACALVGLEADCWGQMTGDGSPLFTVHTSAVGVKGLPANGVSQVSAASGGCALVRLGGLATGLRCWGANPVGQLGNGTTSPSTMPVKVLGLSNGVQSVATGATHSCALVHNSGAYCWGWNKYGQLGDGTTTNRSTAVAVTGLPLKLAQIAAADDHSCALLTAGTVKCWGANGSGQLGDGTTSDSSTPVAVTGLTGVVAIALGSGFTCALTGAGAVECWGVNAQGELGDGSTTDSKTPVAVSGLTSGVVSIAAGDAHACAVLVTGPVTCWGDNSGGELGNGVIGGMSTAPVTVAGFTSNGTSLDMHMATATCALDGNQKPECWGDNSSGELGDGSTADSGSPVIVQGL